jgi:hypothetical protein
MNSTEILNALLPTGLGLIIAGVLACYRQVRAIPPWRLRSEALHVLLVVVVIGICSWQLGQGAMQVALAMVGAATVALGKNSYQSFPPGSERTTEISAPPNGADVA